MSNLTNPLLKMFMKPDKKVIPETTLEERNENQKNDEIDDQKIEINANKQKQKKSKKDKEKPQKKKKVLQENLPDFQENEIPHPKIPNYKYLVPKNGISIRNDLKANPEWTNNFFIWFAQLRTKIYQLANGDNVSLKHVIGLIQKGEMPKSNEACNVKDYIQILYYFERKTTDFTKVDLAWIFSALIFNDRLLNDDTVDSYSNVLTKLIVQINSLQNKEDPLYSYLMIDATLLQQFFHLKSEQTL